jgi:O-methyltransferase
MYTPALLGKYPIISDQVDKAELTALLTELEQLLINKPDGSIVEFGCYRGTTSLFIRRLLNIYDSLLEFHVYDSFEGLPDKHQKDESVAGDQFVTGELLANKREFVEQFKKAGLKAPIIHKGWFSAVTADQVPHAIRFAFLDGDYYESIKDSFRAIEPNLMLPATIIVDDYMNEALPGAAKATDEWLQKYPDARVKRIASLAIITLA